VKLGDRQSVLSVGERDVAKECLAMMQQDTYNANTVRQRQESKFIIVLPHYRAFKIDKNLPKKKQAKRIL
jgi:hypothetical protein